MDKVEVLKISSVKSKEFTGKCWNCDSHLSLQSTSKIPLETVICPVCIKIAELRPQAETAYHEPSIFDWVFRGGKPKRLSDEY